MSGVSCFINVRLLPNFTCVSFINVTRTRKNTKRDHKFYFSFDIKRQLLRFMQKNEITNRAKNVLPIHVKRNLCNDHYLSYQYEPPKETFLLII